MPAPACLLWRLLSVCRYERACVAQCGAGSREAVGAAEVLDGALLARYGVAPRGRLPAPEGAGSEGGSGGAWPAGLSPGVGERLREVVLS